MELIAARVEGNLLAAAQEIEKLKLMAEDGQITVETHCKPQWLTVRGLMCLAWWMRYLTAKLPMPCVCSKACAVKA